MEPHDQDNSQSDQVSHSIQDDSAEPSRERALADADYGYRISFTHMQKMYLRRLQATMIKVAISLRFDTEKEKIKSSILLLEATLVKYSEQFQYYFRRLYLDYRSIGSYARRV
jgi:hypothetical protein